MQLDRTIAIVAVPALLVLTLVTIAIEARRDNRVGAAAAATGETRESNEVRSRGGGEEANAGYLYNNNNNRNHHKKKRKNAKKRNNNNNLVGYFTARKLQKSTRRALNAARRRNFRRKSHHEVEDLKVLGEGGGAGLDGAGAASNRAGDRLLPADFDTARPRPNIVLIMCDDQDVELGSLQFMPKLNRYLREEGAQFENGFVTTPMCCPSRSSMLTGLYAHNHNVLTNNENCSSTEWVSQHEPRTFAAYLNQAGYKTGYFGKYLNKYLGKHVPAGWDEWVGLKGNSKFYNYSLNVNGNRVKHGSDYEADYFPDVITNASLRFLRETKEADPERPVLMVLSYPGPHGPEDSAPQYQDLFFNVTTHHTPAYDYAPNPDKQWILQVTGRMEPIHKQFTDVLMTKRLQTLQSVDDAIARLHGQLTEMGELDNTYVIYTSDHGYHLGQFGVVKGKSLPFEFDIKVPFFVRGPGFAAGSKRPEPVLNIDLAPTMLDIAGVERPSHMDGRSILKVLDQSQEQWRDSFLVERGKMTQVRYEKINGKLKTMAANNATATAAGSAAAASVDIEDTTAALAGEVPMPDEAVKEAAAEIFQRPRLTNKERLAAECLKQRYRAPCGPYQKHKCVLQKSTGEWRMKKCRPSSFSGHSEFFRRDAELTACHCVPGAEFGWRPQLATFASDGEKRRQRDFIKKHTGIKGRKLKKHGNRFLKNLSRSSHSVDPVISSWRRMKHRGYNRAKRTVEPVLDDFGEDESSAAAAAVSDSETEEQEEQPVESVLSEIAKDEIDEVDIIMEDITDEINDLQQSINATNGEDEGAPRRPVDLECRVTDSMQVNCSSTVYGDRNQWRSSRVMVNEQIRRLRAQLLELKEIRKHLRSNGPFGNRLAGPRQVKAKSYEEVFGGVAGIPPNSVECKCHMSSYERERYTTTLRSRQERLKLARLRRRMQRKEKKLRRMKNRKVWKAKKHHGCMAELERYRGNLNCFTHTNDHWKTPPFWTAGTFCGCTNSNTNTYSCLRTVNATHNFLYCEFVSGLITYYDMNVDPYQLRNIYQTLSGDELNHMHSFLLRLKAHRGTTPETLEELQGDRDAGSTASRNKSGRKRKKKHRKNKGHHSKKQSFNNRYGEFLPPAGAFNNWWTASGRNGGH